MDDTSIGTDPTEAMTDDLHVDVEDLDDFDMSDFESKEMLNIFCTSSTRARCENRIDGKHLSKVCKIDRKSADRNVEVVSKRCARS